MMAGGGGKKDLIHDAIVPWLITFVLKMSDDSFSKASGDVYFKVAHIFIRGL